MREDRLKQAKLLRAAFREMMKGVCTATPGHILTYDPARQIAQVQIGIQRVDIDGATFSVDPIIETPVCFPGGGPTLEFKVEPGCEGMIVFSQRCIDGWMQAGGVAANPQARFHHMQDAMFIPGIRSIPGAITAFANNGVRIRNEAGDVFVWVKDDKTISIANGAGLFNMLPSGEVQINGVRITVDGDVITPTGISLKNHRTSGVTPGPGISGVPVI